jgi:hypothetical protein
MAFMTTTVSPSVITNKTPPGNMSPRIMTPHCARMADVLRLADDVASAHFRVEDNDRQALGLEQFEHLQMSWHGRAHFQSVSFLHDLD